MISYSFWRDVAWAIISSYCGRIVASSFSLVAISASMLCCSAAILAYNASINVTAKYTRGRFAINDNILGNLALTIGSLPNRQHSTPTGLCSSIKPLDPPTLVCVPGQANPLAARQHGVEIPVPSKGSRISVDVADVQVVCLNGKLCLTLSEVSLSASCCCLMALVSTSLALFSSNSSSFRLASASSRA